MYPVQAPTTYLAGSGTVVGATSVTVTGFVDIYGNTLTMADFGGTKGQICLEPDTNNEESATFTGITANANGTFTLTGVKTVLAKTPFTETSGLIRAHGGGLKVVISDTSWFWQTYANKNNNETILGRWGSAVVPLNNNDYVNKLYADGLAIAGAPNASTTTKGIGKTSVAPVSATDPINVGDNDPRVPTQAENDALQGTSGTPSNTNRYVTSDDVAENTASKVIRRKSDSNVTVPTTPTAGTDAVSKTYSDLNISIYKNGITSKNVADASTTQTIAHGLGKAPKYIRVTYLSTFSGGTGQTLGGTGVYNGTTISNVYNYNNSGPTSYNVGTSTTNIIIWDSSGGGTSLTQVAVPTFDATNITLTWTRSAAAPTGIYSILWEAFA